MPTVKEFRIYFHTPPVFGDRAFQFADGQVLIAGTTARTSGTANPAPTATHLDVGWVDPFHIDGLAGPDWPVPLHDAGLAAFGWPDPLYGDHAAGLLFA